MTATAPASPLAAALARVQAQLPDLDRDRTVEVQTAKGKYTYSYVTLANLSKAVLPLLAAHGLAFTALPGTGSDGKLCVRYQLLHESGEALTGEFPIEAGGGIQMVGGRITYARRYCLAAIVGVAADEDDEARLADDSGPRTAQRARTAPAATTGRTAQRSTRTRSAPPLPGEDDAAGGLVVPEQHRRMHALWRELGYGGEDFRDERLSITSRLLSREVDSSAGLTYSEADTVIAALAERVEVVRQKAAEQHGGDDGDTAEPAP